MKLLNFQTMLLYHGALEWRIVRCQYIYQHAVVIF